MLVTFEGGQACCSQHRNCMCEDPEKLQTWKCHLPWLMYIAQEGEELKMDSEKQVWGRVSTAFTQDTQRSFFPKDNKKSKICFKQINDISKLSRWLSCKEFPCKAGPREMWVQSLGREDPLKESKATHSRILAWIISWTEEPGGLQSMGLHRVGPDWSNLARALTHTRTHTHTHKWHKQLSIGIR